MGIVVFAVFVVVPDGDARPRQRPRRNETARRCRSREGLEAEEGAGGLRQRRRPSEKAPPDSLLQAIMDESAKAVAMFFDNVDPPVLCDDNAEAGESDRAVASLARAAAAAVDRRDFCDDLSTGLSR